MIVRVSSQGFDHTCDLPCTLYYFSLRAKLIDPSPVKSLLSSPLTAGISIIVGTFCSKEMLHQHEHSITRDQTTKPEINGHRQILHLLHKW